MAIALRTLRTALLPALLLAALHQPATAQRGTFTAHETWTGTIAVQQDEMRTRQGEFPAWSFTVHESTARNALDLWRSEARGRASRVGGSRPLVARNANLPGPLSMPLDVWVMADDDRATGDATLTFALFANDEALPHGREGVEGSLRELAVLLNRAVVQQQIDELRARKKATRGKIESAASDEGKLGRQIAKADRRMEKIKRDQSRVQRHSADLKRRLARQEARLGRNPRRGDLRRVSSTRRDLARTERRLARLKRDEARTLADINKLRSTVPEKQQEQQQQRDVLSDKARLLEALQRKMADIR